MTLEGADELDRRGDAVAVVVTENKDALTICNGTVKTLKGAREIGEKRQIECERCGFRSTYATLAQQLCKKILRARGSIAIRFRQEPLSLREGKMCHAAAD